MKRARWQVADWAVPPHTFAAEMVSKDSDILNNNRIAIRQAVEAARARNPRVFGSVLHGSDVEASDLDLLVDPLPGTTLFDLGGACKRIWRPCSGLRLICLLRQISLLHFGIKCLRKHSRYEHKSLTRLS